MHRMLTTERRGASLAIALTGLVLLLLAGPALADNGQQTTLLLNPAGQPVGGVWQQWMNDSYMPTYNGSMVLDLEAKYGGAPCSTDNYSALGCSYSPAFTATAPTETAMPETALDGQWLSLWEPLRIPADRLYDRFVLMYEQAHILDFRMLSDSQRTRILQIWGKPVPSNETVDEYWWDGTTTSASDVMGEWFSEDYALCSVFWRWHISEWQWAVQHTHTLLVANYPLLQSYDSQTVRMQDQTCDVMWGWFRA
jgi:hypothetical protein